MKGGKSDIFWHTKVGFSYFTLLYDVCWKTEKGVCLLCSKLVYDL